MSSKNSSLSTKERLKNKYLSVTGMAGIAWKIARFVILFGLCFVIIYPFGVKIIDSFKSFQDFLDPTVQYIPKYFTWDNIKTVMEQMGYKNALLTTFLFSALIAIIQVGMTSLVGYGFARFKFWGKTLLFGLVILELIVPPQTIMIPLFIRFRFFIGDISLIGTFWPIIILTLTCMGIKSGLYIYMFRQFFINMPKELEEAAYIDGCNTFQTYYKVMLPSAVSTMVTVFLLSFSWQWTDTTYSSLFRTTGLMANVINNVGDPDMEEVMATTYNNTAAVLSVLPIAIVYLIGQKFFIQGVERSGITG